jgi:hypothetical protein
MVGTRAAEVGTGVIGRRALHPAMAAPAMRLSRRLKRIFFMLFSFLKGKES